MASVCGGSMSLMDAGVPIRKAVAGVAMGLIAEEGKFGVLTDIQGLEDHYGDMDFKVTGTRDGVTALQMDNKAGGITREVLQRALDQAKKGRMQILDKMEAAIVSSRAEISPNAPRILTLQIDPEKIREVIGPGGKMIRSIVQQTGAKIDVEDDGRVYIAGLTDEAAQAAMKIIRDLTRDVQAGETFVGKVTRGISFGFFVEVLPGKEGLLHASEISTFRIPNLEEAFKVGDSVLVMVKEIDDMKRVNLTRRRLLEKAAELEGNPEFAEQLAVEREREVRFEAMKGEPGSRPAAPRGDRPDRGDRPFRGDRGGDRPFRGGDRGGKPSR
jgi:polyribonucleotide nucleotidyltransferase